MDENEILASCLDEDKYNDPVQAILNQCDLLLKQNNKYYGIKILKKWIEENFNKGGTN